MVKPLHLPSVVFCAIGFAAALCGVGSAVVPWLFPNPPEGQGTMDERLLAMYGGTSSVVANVDGDENQNIAAV